MQPISNDTSQGKPPSAQFPRVHALRELLGYDVLLLPWPLGTKATKRRWKHRTVADMERLDYLRQLEVGNIGVALGQVSGGLVSIDFDSDELRDKFLACNPALASTLRTWGARGCNFWVRCAGAFPRSKKLMPRHGKMSVGEWRSDGNQTIISGRHPDGPDYQRLEDAKPIQIAFSSIVWPQGLRPLQPVPEQSGDLFFDETEPETLHSLSVTQRHSDPVTQGTQQRSHSSNSATQETQAIQATQATQDVAALPFFLVSEFVPSQRGESDSRLFGMARRVLTLERKKLGRKATETELETLFNAWWKLAAEHVDPAQGQLAFFAKFLRMTDTARTGDDESLAYALQASLEEPPPPEAELFPGDFAMRRLIAICYHLQLAVGPGKPFYLACRSVAEPLKVSHTTVFDWLKLLCRLGSPYHVLDFVRSGSQAARQANEYRFRRLTQR